MTFIKCVCVVLLAALGVMAVQPAPAEAMDPMVISLIAGAAVVVVVLIAILIIANMSAGPRLRSGQGGPGPVAPLVALQMSVAESP